MDNPDPKGQPRPPFRADHVGSLLRPAAVKRARVQFFEEGSISAQDLYDIESEAIADLVRRQEALGFQVVTDGEARRSFWHYDFMDGLDGLSVVERPGEKGVSFQGAHLRPLYPTIHGPLGFPKDHPMLAHFAHLASTTQVCPKISIPGPSACHFRTASADITHPPYSDVNVLFKDLANAYRQAVEAFYKAGCRYLQMDDIFFAYLCDPKQREAKRAQGMDPDWLVERYAWTMQEAIKDRPSDLVIGMHMCRGNFQSTWVADGGYDPVADAIFNRIDVDVYFMEYDTGRAGGLAPPWIAAQGVETSHARLHLNEDTGPRAIG